MRKLLLLSLITLATFGVAQKSPRPSKTEPSPQPASIPADPKISAALQQISAAQIKRTIDTLVSFGNRSTLSVEQPAASEHGITAAREWIKSEFERYSRDCGGCLEVKLDTFTQPQAERLTKPTEISNVYAVLRGTDPEQAKRMVLVTGHYDSRNSDNFNTTDPAPGANDDASGTAVSLECARVLSKLKFPATIIFLAVAGEEQGLYGSAHFAKIAKDAGWQIEAVLNNDIVGGNRTPGDTGQNPHIVRVFSEGIPQAATEAEVRRIRALGAENDSPSRELARYIAEIGQAYSKDFQPTLIFRPDRYLRGGDHSSFNEQGFAAVRFTEWREDFNHQHQNVRTENGIEYGDLPKFVDFDYVANVARLNAATLAELASAPPPPSNVKLETKQLENGSTLTWEPVPDARYEALWRESGSRQWGRSKLLSDWCAVNKNGRREFELCSAQMHVTLPLSKDNVFFAVRSVDAAGHKSLPVVPLPER
ncbi:MAG TPA: M20/M25/M40 family metallo-hydrolase [Terriglobales bacterium]|nr:M20/M25/M40 family metallo-hydrolase [Terriglobales bacterium]